MLDLNVLDYDGGVWSILDKLICSQANVFISGKKQCGGGGSYHSDILALRKMPANAIPDKVDFVFYYEKDGIKNEFKSSNLPDSTWKYVERKDIIIKGKNNIPLINDFSLTTEDGGDATESILNEPGEYYLFFLKEISDNTDQWINELKMISDKAAKEHRMLFVVTGQKNQVTELMEKNKITMEGVLNCDVTSIKTAARATPTLYLMKGPVIQGKWSWADFEKVK